MLLAESIGSELIRSIVHTMQGNWVHTFNFQCHGCFLLEKKNVVDLMFMDLCIIV